MAALDAYHGVGAAPQAAPSRTPAALATVIVDIHTVALLHRLADAQAIDSAAVVRR